MAIQITNISPTTFTKGMTTPVTITGSGLANVTTAIAAGQITATSPPTPVSCAAGLPTVDSDTQVRVNFTMNWTTKPAQDDLSGNLTVTLGESGGGTGQKQFTGITYRVAP